MKRIRLESSGTTCEDCARPVENALAASERMPEAPERDGAAGFDLLVIGTGAAGMAAAIRGAELGRRVGIVEAGTVGGTCVNVGCIPSKALLAAAERYHDARTGFPGIEGYQPDPDWPGLREQKRYLVRSLRMSKYLDVLASYPGITLLRGSARVAGNGTVEVGGVLHRAPKLVVAAGTSPWTPPIPGIETVEVQTSTTVMELDEVPESMIVLGGSAIGLEMGQLFARFGTRVTIIELLSRLLPAEDEEASEELRRNLEHEGLRIVTGADVTRVQDGGGTVVVHAETPGGSRSFHAQRLLSATGRRANTAGLGLERVGVELDERGFVRVDPGMRTTHPDIFAAGDITGGPGFVYVAAAGGRVAADNALSDAARSLDLLAVPRVTFTSPQLAAVGLNSAQAHERGLEAEVRRVGLEHVPRALVEHRPQGWIQLVAERGSGRILGVQAVGRNAAELLGEATLAVRLGLTIDDVADTLHPYLTWVEGLKLAAQSFRTDVSRLSCCA